MVLAYVGLGSNVGQRSLNFARALKGISEKVGRIIDTSYLYESKAECLTEQPDFLNAVVAVDTNLSPEDLLLQLQTIEFGKSEQRYGPRKLDLDILLYGPLEVFSKGPTLCIPHPRLTERDFVLRPLCDLGISHLSLSETSIANHLKSAAKSSTNRVSEFIDSSGKSKLWNYRSNKIRMMGILNVTPDSFSDGGQHLSVDRAIAHATSLVNDGADIVDIGGESTRPGASPVSEQEEIDRVIPVISKLRQLSEFDHILLSIDTYKPKVAELAAKAGVDVINDVSGGNDDILRTVTNFNLHLIMMHNRGNPQTMRNLTDYGEKGVVQEVADWLESRVLKAVREYNIPRWNIWIDPGFGFAKTASQNYQLLSSLSEIVSKHQNVLVGASRKRFLRETMRHDQDQATAASTTIAALAGANIVRVHDIKANADAIAVVDKLLKYREALSLNEVKVNLAFTLKVTLIEPPPYSSFLLASLLFLDLRLLISEARRSLASFKRCIYSL